MLQALLHGKAGRIEHNGETSVSWRNLFKTREDLITAAIFGRFAYLSSAVQNHLLTNWYGRAAEQLPHGFTGFEAIEFWPRFQLNNEGHKREVEPDIVMRFKHVNLIIEVKPPAGGKQYLEQWRNQIEAFIQSDDKANLSLYYLAIGRIESDDIKRWGNQLKTTFAGQLSAVAGLEWQLVTNAIIDLQHADAQLPNEQDRRVLTDMVAALHLYGLKTSHFKWSALTCDYSSVPLTLTHSALKKDLSGFTAIKHHTFPSIDLNLISQWAISKGKR